MIAVDIIHPYLSSGKKINPVEVLELCSDIESRATAVLRLKFCGREQY